MHLRTLFFLAFLFACRHRASVGNQPNFTQKQADSLENQAVSPQKSERRLSHVFQKTKPPADLPIFKPDAAFGKALFHQTLFLEKNGRAPSERLASGILESDLLDAVERLQHWQCLTPVFLEKNFDFYLLNTNLPDDFAKITGYYTPVVEASRRPTSEFRCPIFRRPTDGPMPSRSQIEAGFLKNKGLEIGFLRSEKALRNAQMQGSCFLKFTDGSLQLIGYDGTNEASRTAETKFVANESTEPEPLEIVQTDPPPTEPTVSKKAKKKGKRVKMPRNESNFVFFRPMNNEPTGAASQPLSASYSISVDPRFIPLGSVLLAELPAFQKEEPPQYRILFAQDVGGGIRGTGRFDLYCGVGEPFLPSCRVNDFGKIWLLLPK